MNPRIRPVRPEDALAVARHRYFRGEPATDIETYASWLAPRIAAGTYIGHAAETGDGIVAGAGAVLLDWGPTRGDPNGTRARIANVYTEAAWRSHGLARALVRQVMQDCAVRGIRVFNLASSDDGRALYRSLGFVDYEGEMILRGR